jgi:protein-tyrosine phosphatase
MGFDYTSGCVNFRDVGEVLNLLADRTVMPERRILRGGTIDRVGSLEEIGSPGIIVSVRKGPDSPRFPVEYVHVPISNEFEKYETGTREVRVWLRGALAVLERDATKYPVLFHCTSGKDRSAVVIAALLRVLEIPCELIVEEYLWSEGRVEREWIEGALDGIGDPERYFDRLDLAAIRRNVLGRTDSGDRDGT